MSHFSYRFCLITDFHFINDNNLQCILEKAIEGGVDLIQYRDFYPLINKRLKRAETIRKITRDNGVGMIINGPLDLVKEVDADGVQLGRWNVSISKARKYLGKKKIIGVSVHNKIEVLSAASGGSDFLLLSPIFKPGSKPSHIAPLGGEKFLYLSKLAKQPVLALGGITEKNVHIPLKNGAFGIACITAILCSDNILKSSLEIKNKLLEKKSKI